MRTKKWIRLLAILFVAALTLGCGGSSDDFTTAGTSSQSQTDSSSLLIRFDRNSVLSQTTESGFAAADIYAVSVLVPATGLEAIPTRYFPADLSTNTQTLLVTGLPSGTFDVIVSAFNNGSLVGQVASLNVTTQLEIETTVGGDQQPLLEYRGDYAPAAPGPQENFGGSGGTSGGTATSGGTSGGTATSGGNSGGNSGGTATGGSGGTTGGVGQQPPFAGTVFLSGDIIVDTDPTTYQSISYQGQAVRNVFDRRTNSFNNINAFIFDATFSDRANAVEVIVNPEFGTQSDAQTQAEFYAAAVGRIPAVLKTRIDALWIHQGVELFGGGNQSILIHTGQTTSYQAQGILEEVLVHEASHTSLDWSQGGIVSETAWQTAQVQDDNFISTYARDNSATEDVAESFLPYIIVRLRSDRVSPSLVQTIQQTIPNRMTYFDSLSLDLSPVDTSN